MKKMMEKLNAKLAGAQLAAKRFLKEERGDTNFISIALILVVVALIGVVFAGFGKTILGKLQQAINDITGAF